MKFAFFTQEYSDGFLQLRKLIKNAFSYSEVKSLEEIYKDAEFTHVFLDFDVLKNPNKLIQGIKNYSSDIKIVLLSNVLTQKELLKHQSSKESADIYLRTPVTMETMMILFEEDQDLGVEEEIVQDEVPDFKVMKKTEEVVDVPLPEIPEEETLSLEEMESSEEENFELAEENEVVNEEIEMNTKKDELELMEDDLTQEDISLELSEDEEEEVLDLSSESSLELESFDLESEDLSLSDDSLELSESSLEMEESSLELDEAPLEFSSMDTADDSLNLELKEEPIEEHNDILELPKSEDIEALGLEDDVNLESFEEPSVEAPLETELSQDALNKLKEIDALMSEDKSFESFLDEQEDKGAEVPFDSFENLQFEEEKTQVESPTSSLMQREPSEATEVLKTSEVIQGHYEELDKIGMTITELRKERGEILSEIDILKDKLEAQKREMLTLRSELDEKKIENQIIRKRYEKNISDMKIELDVANEKKQMILEKNKELEKEKEILNQKVRFDVKKIQTREKELESRLELLKADSEIQIRNRDHRILELKRKIDNLEFELENIQVNEEKIKDSKYGLEEKMDKVMKSLRNAIEELEGREKSDVFKKLKNNLEN